MTVLESKKYKEAYAGQTVTMPVLGSVQFEKDGRLKVEDDSLLEEFIEATKPSFDFKVQGAENSKKKKATKKGGDPQDPQDEDEKDMDEDEIEAKLEAMSSDELSELVKSTPNIDLAKAATWTDAKIRKELLKRLVK